MKQRAVISGAYTIEIEGLKAFAKAVKALSDEYPKELKNANSRLAREVVKRARATAKADSKLSAKAAGSLRANRSGTSAVVTGGGPRYPYFWGAEFGAKQYRQFKSWRGNQWGGWDGGPGYFLNPTIRRDARALVDEYMKELDRLADKAFSN